MFGSWRSLESRNDAAVIDFLNALDDDIDEKHQRWEEQLRSLFDESGLGMILIGCRASRSASPAPQFFSRIGFVHEFRPLSGSEMQTMLEQGLSSNGTENLHKELVLRPLQQT